MNLRWFTLLLFCAFVVQTGQTQVEKQASSAEIYEALLKLNNTATVMFVAAHPDDENTRLISWLSNHKHVNTVYLSLTRGDGGQNLIGTEKGPLLGLLRTQELLQARSIDGGHQFFTRANDFGYSKTATETRAIWEEEEIMSDVVWAFRKHQPDIVINRFDHNSNGRTHGHHTFSAIASLEAFDLSGDRSQFPDQLTEVDPWQPDRIFFNTSWWFYGSQENFDNADKSKMVAVDIGEYYPVRGISNNEIAAQSRSMHKCQGFGSAASRGSQMEYLEFLEGNPPTTTDGRMTDLFDGIDMTWNRIRGGDVVDKQLTAIIENYDFSDPAASVNALLELRTSIESFHEVTPLLRRKRAEVNQIIVWCAALYTDVTTSTSTAAPGDSVDIVIESINRGREAISLRSFRLLPGGQNIAEPKNLDFNAGFDAKFKIAVPADAPISTPYWLKEEQKNIGMYVVDEQALRGQPESPPVLTAEIEYEINGHTIIVREPVQHKYTDPAIGEIYEPFVVAPAVTVNLADPVYILSNNQPTQVKVEVRSHRNDVSGEAYLKIEDGWTIEPKTQKFDIAQQGDKRVFTFQVTPPAGESVTVVQAMARVDDRTYNLSYTSVEYDHIPKQTVFLPCQAMIEHLKITIPNMRIGYISGAGDEIPQSLEQLGILVDEIDPGSTSRSELSQYSSIIIGIRAFNTIEELKYFTDDLWSYAEAGGTVIVQYNTNRRLLTDVAPLKLELSRNRITEEDATLNILQPEHPVFNYPNELSTKDFDQWVQERGLYFADAWDEAFVPLLSGHDTGEEDLDGMLLVAPYGKGYYVYTGLSFFRQLPAGVPGAYRLFVNLLSLQHDKP